MKTKSVTQLFKDMYSRPIKVYKHGFGTLSDEFYYIMPEELFKGAKLVKKKAKKNK
jgi:hypothetical protein